MKKNAFLLLRRCQFPLFLLLSFMPVMLITACMNAPDALGCLWILFAVYMTVSSLCLLVPGKIRMLLASLGCAALLILSVLCFPIKERTTLLLIPFGLSILLFLSLPLAMRQYESDVPPFVYFIGVAVHFVAQFLNHYFTDGSGVSPYAPVSGALTASLIGYVLLFLLSMNRISLDNASLARYRLPAGMRGINTALTILFIAVSLMLSIMPSVIRGVTLLFKTLSGAIVRFFAFLLSFLPSAPDAGYGMQGGMGAMIPMGAEAPEPSAFAVLLEKIATVATTIIILVGTLILLRLLLILTMRLVRHVTKRLRAYMSAASAEYEDEVTDTREDGAQREIRFLRRSRPRSARHDDTPAGRIRSGYAKLMHRNPKWPASSTARENLPETAASLYERARYSEHPVTGEDAKHFLEEIKKA